MTLSDLDRYDAVPAEHECPTPLQRRVEEFTPGGMFFSPAGRWETITDTTGSLQVRISTDRTGDGYGWVFWSTDRLPYLPSYLADGRRGVMVCEFGSLIEARITDSLTRRYHYHDASFRVLISARQVRGTGWIINDRPTGGEVEEISKPSKATARTEVNRRARAHAKALGLPMWKAVER